MGKQIVLFIILAGFFMQNFSQDVASQYASYGDIVKFKLSNALFPHPKRANGYVYQDKTYPADPHYIDSSVAVLIPKDFTPGDATDLVIHFHGWSGTIDGVIKHYNLVDQFCRSGKNALLVFPEGPKNAPDSFGGKLEERDGFKKFVEELIQKLYDAKRIKTKNIGKIIVSGHSGGYHVIAFILMHGGMNDFIKEAWLFDALYGQTEKLAYWVDHSKGKLINIYTTDGGTKTETERMIECLEGWQIPYIAKLEKDITPADLKNNRNIFIYSDLSHNEVIFKKGEFFEYLKASCLDDIK
jgi:hypothetical protein